MADREVVHERTRSASSGVVWLALVLSIVALVLAWIAYNRTGEDLESKIQQQLSETSNSVEQQVETETPDATR